MLTELVFFAATDQFGKIRQAPDGTLGIAYAKIDGKDLRRSLVVKRDGATIRVKVPLTMLKEDSKALVEIVGELVEAAITTNSRVMKYRYRDEDEDLEISYDHMVAWGCSEMALRLFRTKFGEGSKINGATFKRTFGWEKLDAMRDFIKTFGPKRGLIPERNGYNYDTLPAEVKRF